jgi:hypothetical protein
MGLCKAAALVIRAGLEIAAPSLIDGGLSTPIDAADFAGF